MSSNAGRIAALIALLTLMLGACYWSVVQDREQIEKGDSKTRLGHLFSRKGLIPQGISISGTHRPGSLQGGPGSKDAPSAKDPELSCSLSGLACNEETTPIKDVKITVRSGSGVVQEVTTNDAGHFQVYGLQPATYDILAAHPTYATLIRPNFTVRLHEDSPELKFVMPLGNPLKGKVVDEEDKPIKDAQILSHKRKRAQLADGETYLDDTLYKTQRSQADGTFLLTGIAAGENILEVSGRGYELSIKPVNVIPEKINDEIKVVLKKTGKIGGIVVDDRQYPVGTATVCLTRYKPFGAAAQVLAKEQFTTITDERGRFSFSKLHNEGFYDLSIEHEAFAPGIFPLITVGTEQLTCVLDQGGGIEGRVEYVDRPTTPAVVLVAAEVIIKGTTFTKEVQSDGKGEFKFARLPFGSYRLYSDSSEIQSEPKTDIPCVKGKPTKDVLLEVYQMSRVKGRVSDAENDTPIEGATVTVQSTYGYKTARSKAFELHSDSHGQFEFGRLPGGMHTVKAIADGFLKNGKGQASQSFRLEPGESKSDVALRLDHGGSIEGFVLDPNGRAVAGCKIQLFQAGPGPNPEAVKALAGASDNSGYFKIRGIEVGDRAMMYASASKPGFAKSKSPLCTLTAKKPECSTQINLLYGATVSGRVTDTQSMPIARAEVKLTSGNFPGDPTPSEVKVYTGPDGSYEVPHCPVGGTGVVASRSGFVEQRRDLTLVDAKRTDNVDFKLQSGIRIAGRVASLDGDPIANAKVTARPVEGAGTDQAVTDKNGYFSLTNLGKGTFRVEASFPLKTADGDQNYVFVLPKVASGTDSAFIDCDVGNSASGLVTGEGEKALNTFSISLRSRTDTRPSQDFTFNLDRGYNNSRGLVRILSMPRGVYSLTVSSEGYEPYRLENLQIGPHQRTTLPHLNLQPAGGITGSLESATSGKPLNDVIIRLLDKNKSDSEARASAIVGRSDFAGNFRVSCVPAGIYSVEFEHPSYLPLRLDDVSVSRKRNSDLGKVTLDAGGVVQGIVSDAFGNPVPGVSISISDSIPVKQAATDLSGNYLIQGVRPGQWAVVANGTVNSRRVYTFTTIHVQPDEPQQADFVFETSADLDGTILTQDSSLQSASVRIHPFDEHANVIEDIFYDATMTTPYFSINAVPPGQYFLWSKGFASSTPYSLWQNTFLNRGRNTVSLNVGSSQITGRIVKPDGVPAAGCGLQLMPLFDNLRIPKSLYNSLIRPAFADSQGVFRFNNLNRGAYQLIYLDPAGGLSTQWIAMPPVSVQDGQILPNYNIPPGQ